MPKQDDSKRRREEEERDAAQKWLDEDAPVRLRRPSTRGAGASREVPKGFGPDFDPEERPETIAFSDQWQTQSRSIEAHQEFLGQSAASKPRQSAADARHSLRKRERRQYKADRRRGPPPPEPTDPLDRRVWELWIAGDCHLDNWTSSRGWNNPRYFDEATIARRTAARSELIGLMGDFPVPILDRDDFTVVLDSVRLAESARHKEWELSLPACQCDGTSCTCGGHCPKTRRSANPRNVRGFWCEACQRRRSRAKKRSL